ncbi:collectin subfamily member 12 [Plakobranchus ocellatus]|uniref:Collectin subfamily member 12 n=1 Tax=Plakobranchus ocellatus TaxID=259542 RepID=A0AAV3ZUN4_9GAST|nr:collectin subfamily member 12 [Plakobranchus ocellatus]
MVSTWVPIEADKQMASMRVPMEAEEYIVSMRVPMEAEKQMVLMECRSRQKNIMMSPMPILLLVGILMIGPVQGYVTYDISPVYKGRRYLISKELEYFNLATMNDRCKKFGGYLVQFDDAAEQKKVGFLVLAVPGKGPFFTGLTDNVREGWFYTYNDKKWAKYHKFQWFQPDNWWNEDCVEVWDNGLNDIRCGKRGRYVCEVPV